MSLMLFNVYSPYYFLLSRRFVYLVYDFHNKIKIKLKLVTPIKTRMRSLR